MLRKFILWFIPPELQGAYEDLRKSRVLVGTLWITYLFTVNYAVTSIFIDYQPGFVVEGIASFWYLFLPFLFKWTGNINLVTNLMLISATFCITVVIWFAGGFIAPTLPWLCFPPIVALLLADRMYAWFWLVVCLIITSILGTLTFMEYPFPEAYNLIYKDIFTLICATGLIAILFLICIVFDNAKTNALFRLDTNNKLLSAEKKKSDNLLLNILPEETIKELQEKGKTEAKYYDLATIMFADVIGFTKIAMMMSPQEIVNALDEFFSAFDEIMDRFKIEKIKTIGDAYVAAGGIPVADSDNPTRVIESAKACMEAADEINEVRKHKGLPVFNFRIGIHSGPVIAGVVGKNKFAYDIWGDTVNTAARMEETSKSGHINISQNTYDHVKNIYTCDYRGKIKAKNKGELHMYFVNS